MLSTAKKRARVNLLLLEENEWFFEVRVLCMASTCVCVCGGDGLMCVHSNSSHQDFAAYMHEYKPPVSISSIGRSCSRCVQLLYRNIQCVGGMLCLGCVLMASGFVPGAEK